MKKTFLALLLGGSCCAAIAQVTTDTTTHQTQNQNWNQNTMQTQTNIQGNQHTIHHTMTTTGEYNAYGTTSATIPSTVQVYFDRDYPNAGAVTWRKKGDWYHATYNNMGRYNHVYYNEGGSSYSVSLPVTQNYVPDDIVAKVGNMFGDMVYDIATVKGQNGDIYHVRTMEGEQLKSNWVGEDGVTITDPFRPAETDVQTDMNTNQNTNTNLNQTTEGTQTENLNLQSDTMITTPPDSLQNNTPDEGINNQDGSKNNLPIEQTHTQDFAIIPQNNDLRKKS